VQTAKTKNISMVLIIDLNTNLTIFKSQDKNLGEAIFTQDKVNGALNLTDNFIETFQSLPEVDEYYLFIGDNAGFMDSRVIYIWLSNNYYFMGKEFYVNRINFNVNKINIYLEDAKSKGYKDLAYSREPNIGVKK
jgi:hypothetical protein